jgi:signal transduction histidine kinase
MQDGSLEISKERLSFIQDEVNQLNRLVNDLRTLALADMGQLNISKDLITINTLFTHLKNAYAIPSEAKDISLTFENFGESTLFADEGRLIQVISNLLNNAIRHTDPGGSISVQSYNPTDGSTIIEVEDTGEGIPKEDLPNIFNRFYRGDPSRQGYESESGLGLSIVKALIEAHGGSVRVESTLGEGTIFYITLPAAD